MLSESIYSAGIRCLQGKSKEFLDFPAITAALANGHFAALGFRSHGPLRFLPNEVGHSYCSNGCYFARGIVEVAESAYALAGSALTAFYELHGNVVATASGALQWC
ncbi:hypothetical protein ACRQGT_01260 [Actinotignum sp. GS-2025c]|uniref:hypothetical protein n=1 Tax=Actinotignum TaxID=1653174 RepID=UPI00254C476E|nr:hypothetical protein [Actinotignum timonense]MDK6926505.1 hypothetical protein [Actinotignum timonense]